MIKNTLSERIRSKANKDKKKMKKRKWLRRAKFFVFTPTSLKSRLCQASYAFFVKIFWHVISTEPLKWNWHMQFLCDELQEAVERVMEGKKKKYDLLINISPGTSKSSLCSVLLQAWCWTRMPRMRHICASHTEQLVFDLSRKSRDVVKSKTYQELFPWVELTETQDSKGHWVNTHKGDRLSCTVSGKTPLGFHAHVIVVDDPIDPKKAESELERTTANDFMDRTLSSRKVDKEVTLTILVMQRLHEDDPAANMLKRKNVRHICLPAEITNDIKPAYLKKYYKDGYMDPHRLGKTALDEAKTLGDYYYASQFLQTPTPKGGGMFKVSKIAVVKEVDAPRRFKKLVRYWDKAATMGAGAYTVGTLMGLDHDDRYWVLDVIRERYDSGTREHMIKAIAKKDGKKVWVGLEQEPGSGGKESAEGTVRRLPGYVCHIYKPGGSGKRDESKVGRADPWSSQINSSNVFIVQAGWNEAWLSEHRFFPYGTYKDQVDSATGAFSILHGKNKKKRVVAA